MCMRLATVDLIIYSDAEPQRSEYERLLATMTPLRGLCHVCLQVTRTMSEFLIRGIAASSDGASIAQASGQDFPCLSPTP